MPLPFRHSHPTVAGPLQIQKEEGQLLSRGMRTKWRVGRGFEVRHHIMGCISSKFAVEENDSVFRSIVGDCPGHVVSLTSTTYGALNLDREARAEDARKTTVSPLLVPFRKSVSREEPPEVINAWELMSGLEEEIHICSPAKKPANAGAPFWCSPKGLKSEHMSICSPLKKSARPSFLLPSPKEINQLKEDFMSPRNFSGKENSQVLDGPSPGVGRSLKPFSPIENTLRFRSPASLVRHKATPTKMRAQSCGRDSGRLSGRRKSLSPMFEPELVASFEVKEQIKVVVSTSPRINNRAEDSKLLLESFERNCPPGGEETVVLYTTSLRGIRKTFEDCNSARSAIETYGVQVLERDISMDSGFREELRVLMGSKDVSAPVAFVKGRLVGGAAEVLKLEEEGRLELLLDGIPRAVAWCDGCGGWRFVMCMDCNGSCKVLDEEQDKVVKCDECNENGLIRCPICS